jgi:hypothetical protein
MDSASTIRLRGQGWGTDGVSSMALKSGTNLVGVPLDDDRLNRVSDLLTLPGFTGNIASVIVSNVDVVAGNGQFMVVTQPGDDGDIPITGDMSLIITATADATAEITGKAWDNVTGTNGGSAPPVTLLGLRIDRQTPVLALKGSVVDEITGQAKDGFSITVKNLSTGSSYSAEPEDKASESGYSITFVDTKSSRAARIGDILEIAAESANPLIGVEPLRHIVTADDVKKSRIELAELVAYEIPAKTELRPNYPNPFNPETWIPFRLAEDAKVTLTIYDTTGKVVRAIDVGFKPAAVYETKAKAVYWEVGITSASASQVVFTSTA